MRAFFRLILETFALVVLVVFLLPAVVNRSIEGSSLLMIQILLVCVLIQTISLLIRKIECKRRIVEISLEISMVMSIVLGCGRIFNWYPGSNTWILALMVCGVYAMYYGLNYWQIQKEIEGINQKLH